jgi:hypothetical protein
MDGEWSQVVATWGIGGAMLILALMWVRARIAAGKLGIELTSATAAALERIAAKACEERDAAQARAERAERCLECAAVDKAQAEGRYIAILEELAKVRRAVTNGGEGNANQ